MATTFHGFEIKEKIGSGGMSTVYRGLHATLGYPVAVKVLHPGLAGDESFIARFEREAKASSALRNNNIALVIDFGSEDDVYFIVMEYVDGPDLQKLFLEFQKSGKTKPFPAEVALLLLEEVAYGLRAAHNTGIIHRDMKPSNVLINKDGEVKIADFGLARDTRDMARLTAQNLTQPGTVVGTPSYMSPEQAAGKDDLDHRTDIFSLGVMAYQLLTGEKPFRGDTPTQVQESIINDPVPPIPQERCPLLTEEISDMVGKMLAKDPAKRYQNMDQVMAAVKECMDSIDRSGSISKYRRDYLTRFAKEPLPFAEELRHNNIKAHLNLGFHYKNMGLENIEDAIREFRYVLSLDPTHEKASEAVLELERKAEESGAGRKAVPAAPDVEDRTGATLVLPQAKAGPAAGGKGVAKGPIAAGKAAVARPGETAQGRGQARAAPAGAPGKGGLFSGKRGLWIGGAAVVVLAVIALFAFSPKGGKPPAVTMADQPATRAPVTPATPTGGAPAAPTAAPGAPSVQPSATPATTPPTALKPGATPAGGTPGGAPGAAPTTAAPGTPGMAAPAATPGATAPPAATPVAGAKPAAARKGGWVRVVISPHGDVYLDGKLIQEKTKAPVIAASAGSHTMTLRDRASYGRIELPSFRVAAGETLNLGFQKFKTGTLRVAASPAAYVTIDGIETGRQTPFLQDKIGAGEHLLAVRCTGYVPQGAHDLSGGGAGKPLPTVKGADGSLQYRLLVAENQEARVRIDLAKTP